MLNPEQIDALHRLHWAEKWPVRKIARHLKLGRRSVAKYLASPAPVPVPRERPSKLDPYKPLLSELLEQDPAAPAVVIAQRLRPQGFAGGITILKNYLHGLRASSIVKRALVRVEPAAGERFDIDWGHFGALDYQGDARKLYAFALVECHSRKLYVEFTHGQSFETFARCHIHAFHTLGGVARDLVYDNLATAVAEHDGNLVRFNPRFLALAREFSFYPRACHVAAAWEKGRIERAIGYVRQNFWPLRSFTDLADINRQVRQWLAEVANQRVHRETRERPEERFRPECLRPVPAIIPDYRDTVEALVHKDLRLWFDGNRYGVPPRYVGHRLTIKADSSSLTIYERVNEIVSYPRSWRRGQTFGADRFEPELAENRPAAKRSLAQQRLIALLGHAGETYLRGLADTDRSLMRQMIELLELIRQYGPEAVASAIEKAQAAGAFGADYVANILRQQQARRDPQPPLRLRNPQLNDLVTDPLSLLDYDSFILDPEKKS
jgi:transposase